MISVNKFDAWRETRIMVSTDGPLLPGHTNEDVESLRQYLWTNASHCGIYQPLDAPPLVGSCDSVIIANDDREDCYSCAELKPVKENRLELVNLIIVDSKIEQRVLTAHFCEVGCPESNEEEPSPGIKQVLDTRPKICAAYTLREPVIEMVSECPV
jgi:hypothetical protein